MLYALTCYSQTALHGLASIALETAKVRTNIEPTNLHRAPLQEDCIANKRLHCLPGDATDEFPTTPSLCILLWNMVLVALHMSTRVRRGGESRRACWRGPSTRNRRARETFGDIGVVVNVRAQGRRMWMDVRCVCAREQGGCSRSFECNGLD
jgi:hypothetical protein